MSDPTSSACCCCCRHDRADRRVRGDDHRRRRRRRDHGGVLQSARRRPPELPGLRRRGSLPRHRDPQSHRCAGRRAPASAAGRVPRYRCTQRLRAGSVRPQHRSAGPAGMVDHAALRALHPAPADDRPDHHRRSGPRAGPVVGHRQHHRHGRHPDDRGRRHRPVSTGCGSSASTSTAGRTPADSDGRLRHRDHRPDPGAGGHRPGPAARPGPRTLGSGADELAGHPVTGLPRPGRGRGHGRVRRLQDRRHRATARRHHGHGPIPCRRPGRRQARPVPPTRPTADLRSPRPHRGSALPGAAHPAHPTTAAQHAANKPG